MNKLTKSKKFDEIDGTNELKTSTKSSILAKLAYSTKLDIADKFDLVYHREYKVFDLQKSAFWKVVTKLTVDEPSFLKILP